MTSVDLLSQKPLSGVAFSLCAKTDSLCSFPLAQAQSNGLGQIDIDLPAGFDGYLQAEGAGIYPTLIFPPSTRIQRTASTLPLVPGSFYSTLITGVGATAVEDRSMVLVTGLDCQGIPAAGLSLTSPQSDSQTVAFTVVGGLPSRVASSTDESGGGGFVNLPAGATIINATLAASNRPVGTAGILTRPGYLSMVVIMPSGN
jgi:hypothetical protein